MKTTTEIAQEDFDFLLSWLALSRDEAGEQYEQIRNGLVRFFRFRGSTDPAVLADETINRVASRIRNFDLDPKVKKISIFYGFATKIHLESISRTKSKEVQFEPDIHGRDFQTIESTEIEDKRHACLESCLGKLSREENSLIVTYYSESKNARQKLRQELAHRMNLKMGALHTKVCRIRIVLRTCIERCIEQGSL